MSGLSERERAIRRQLKGDFPHYAAKCLKIRPKSGGLVPLVLNRVQLEIHGRLEEQLSRRAEAPSAALSA